MNNLPDLKSFWSEDLENDRHHERIIDYYKLKGKSFTAIEKYIKWLLNNRINAEIEGRAAWTDRFFKDINDSDENQNDIPLLEGCWAILYIISNSESFPILNSLNKKALTKCFTDDFLKIVTGENPGNYYAINSELRERMEKIGKGKNLINVYGKSPLSYINNSKENTLPISTEYLAKLLNLLVLSIKVNKSKDNSIFDIMKSETPLIFEFIPILLDKIVDKMIDLGLDDLGFGIFYDSKAKWINEINYYNTYLCYKSFTEYFDYFVHTNESSAFKKNSKRIIEFTQKISSFLVDNGNRHFYEGKTGWSLNINDNKPDLNGSTFAILILLEVLEFYSKYKTKFAIKDEELKTSIENSVNSLIVPHLSDILVRTENLLILELIDLHEKASLDMHQNNDDIVFNIYDINFYYIRVLINYILIFNPEYIDGKKVFKWNKAWNVLIDFTDSTLNNLGNSETQIGSCLPFQTRKDSFPTVSLIATIRGVEVISEFGIDKNSKSGMIDIINDTLISASNTIINEFYSKFSELEDMGYRIAWNNIIDDYSLIQSKMKKAEVLSSSNEFNEYLSLEKCIKKIQFNPSEEYIISWIRDIISLYEDKNAIEINEIREDAKNKADDFNRIIIDFLTDLSKISNPSIFRTLCSDVLQENKLSDKVTTLFPIHNKLLEELSSINSDEDIINHKSRFVKMKSIILNILNEEN